ncbi:MAG: dynamin family protein, partial [Geodermatophilaceae bacterium]|nr:dynamin family protein [Geodermatophilaceae bacterium]
MTTTESETSTSAIQSQFCTDAVQVLRTLGRTDLAVRVDTAAARLRRPATLICVVGEFKQGKSSLVNALIGQDLCPVDDDLATSAITVLHHGDTAQTVVHRRDDGRKVTEVVSSDELATYVSERGNPDNTRRIDRVDVAMPNALLDRGLM